MNKNKSNKSRKKKSTGIIFKSIAGLVIMFTVFSAAIAITGFNSFTDALLDQYYEGALNIARAANAELDGSKTEEYAQSAGSSEEYMAAYKELDKLCNSSGSTFIYVIRPDLTDYKHITFLFSTINKNTSYTPYEFGYVRETTNDEYIQKYKKLYDGSSESELVVRDRGYIETDPHITAMIPLKDSSGKTAAIICVQRQMEDLVDGRNGYVVKVFKIMIVLAIIVIIIQSLYLSRVLLRPVKKITKEASRFAEENSLPPEMLSDTIKSRDEIGVLASSLDTMEKRITQYVRDLTKATAEKERINTELSLAARIQEDMLPSGSPEFTDHKEFRLNASMVPAKEVGGDFYDYFLIDNDHLCIVMADVSGKGIPASLFMMASKIILADNALTGKSPAQILTAANNMISSGNTEDMFVTAWLGILELSTGRLTAANAGHEYPAIKAPDGRFDLYKDKHGFVIGGMSGIKYKDYELQLLPGSKLFLYTDGIPEAINADTEQFGTDRMLKALNADPFASTGDILKNVSASVSSFVGSAEQSDDLTMLCLEYNGT